MQDARRAAWSFPASDWQRGSAPASAARMFELFMDRRLVSSFRRIAETMAKLNRNTRLVFDYLRRNYSAHH